MKVSTPKEFFYRYISLISSLVEEDMRLTHREVLFLVECCMYNYTGNDLTNLEEFTDHIVDIKFFNRRSDVSLYKYKLGLKKWAKTGKKDIFTLPGLLGAKEGEPLVFNFKIELDSEG